MRLRSRVIDSAVLRELSITFLLALTAFNFILMTEKLLRLTKTLSSAGASMSDMALIALYIQPGLFILTTPMSLLIAVLVTYGRMSMDSELTAMRATGMSFDAISAPSVKFGAICFAVSLLFSFYAAPEGSTALRKTVSRIVMERAAYSIEEGAFNTSFSDMVIHVNSKPSPSELNGVFIHDGRDSKYQKSLYAKEGIVRAEDDGDISFFLKEGFVHLIDNALATEILFDAYDFKVPVSFKEPSATRSELTPLGLLEKTDEEIGERKIKLFIELHRRLTLPLLCLVLAMLCPSLSLMSGKSGRLGGFAIGLAVFALYYSAMLYGENLAISGVLPHYVGSWGALSILGAIVFAVNRKAQKI